MKVFYSQQYMASGHSFDTTRKAFWVADSLEKQPIEGVEIVAPESLSFEEITRSHSADYVEAVRSGKPRELAESQGFTWDPGLWEMVCATNGGAVAAARAAMRDGIAGSLSSGLHHARYGRGAGFCTFNGLSLAAQAALYDGAWKVLIVDFDAHCGGGTYSLIKDDSRIAQVDLSLSDFDRYWPTPGGRTLLRIVEEHGVSYVKDCAMMLDSGLSWLNHSTERPGLVLYNAGMDPHDVGVHREILKTREEIVFQRLRNIPTAFVLAGGYVKPDFSIQDVAALHRLTIEAAALVNRKI